MSSRRCGFKKLEYGNLPMPVQAEVVTPRPRRNGRPRKRADEVLTRNRIIAAATQAVIELGVAGANITDIAARAGISGPAVYKHFAGRADLLIQAAKHSLDDVAGIAVRGTVAPIATARLWMSPRFERTRRLLRELHVAAERNDVLRDLLAQWHTEQAARWQASQGVSIEQVKAFYLLLLGFSQIDSLASLDTNPALLQDLIDRMVAALFDNPSHRS